jgi:hypothetical protein
MRVSNLVIEFNAAWSLSSFVGEGVRLRPVLIVSASVDGCRYPLD